jgi:hypothetical protein
MIRVKISNAEPCVNFLRQTPQASGQWGNCIFSFNEDIEECDYWIIYDSINETEITKCYPENTILFTGEPASIKTYSSFFLNQFHTVFSFRKDLKHPNVILSQPALPWLVGAKFNFQKKEWDKSNIKTWDDFMKDNPSEKSKQISVITSNKTTTEGHRKRIEFLEKVSASFVNQIDFYGSGFNEIQDKFDGFNKYKYSLVIENSSCRDYWTEKLTDCFLSETYPIYYGCPNIFDYFPEGSLSVIDIDKPEEAISHIKSLLENNEYERSLDLIKSSKELILNKYNLFPIITNYINSIDNNSFSMKKRRPVKIYPEKRIQKKLRKMARRFFPR